MKMQISKFLMSASFLMASALGGGMTLRGEMIHISTPATSLVLDGAKGSDLNFVYYGAALSDADVKALGNSGIYWQKAYPVYGLNPSNESAMAVVHSDGNMTLDLAVEDIARRNENGTEVTTVTMRDKVYPVTVRLNYRTYPGEDVIETWTETVNGEKGVLTLTQFCSGHLPIRKGDVWLSSLYGSWGNEGRIETEPLTQGMKVIQNKDGVRNYIRPTAR